MTSRPSRSRELLLALATVLIATTLFLGATEIVLRFLPVASGLRTQAVTTADPVMHFTPDRPFTYSKDWDFALVNHGHTNNAGFVNDQDYRKDDPRPLLAVIGDSYIEAAMVPFAATVHGRLAKALDGRFRVYSFAASGAPLSQYLIWARHAARDYGATSLVITVVGNDFDESHVAYKSAPGFWLYTTDAAGKLVLTLQQYHPGALRDLVYHSALARYLLFNMAVARGLIDSGLLARLTSSTARAAPPQEFAGNTSSTTDARRMDISSQVIAAFFRDLPVLTGLPPNRIAFLLDGFRYPEAAQVSGDSYFGRMRAQFMAAATAQGYETIDLDPYFFASNKTTGAKFESAGDGHWNSIGHELAARAVLESKLLKGVAP